MTSVPVRVEHVVLVSVSPTSSLGDLYVGGPVVPIGVTYDVSVCLFRDLLTFSGCLSGDE